jgi:hypothetical protein
MWRECYCHVSFNYTQVGPGSCTLFSKLMYTRRRAKEMKRSRIMLREIFSEDFTFTKRHLGVMLLVAGVLIVAAMAAGEVLSSTSAGIGTMQRLGFLVGGVSAVVGLTLLPLGSHPA